MNNEQQKSEVENAPVIQEKTGEIRDDKGRFVPGVSGNPNGRPKGISITEMVKEALEKFDKNSGEPLKVLLVKQILKKAITDGDKDLIKAIWAYIDGQPTQKIEADVQTTNLDKVEEVVNELKEYVKSENDGSDQNAA